VTIGSVCDSFFSYKDLWIKYTETTNDLKELKSNLEYLKSGNIESISEVQIDALYSRYTNILKNSNANWSSVRNSKTDNKDKD
jgi:hypothetical protein